MIYKQTDGDKVIVQYDKSGRKSETTVDECRVVEVKEVMDIKLLFDCGVEKYMYMVEEREMNNNVTTYLCVDGTQWASNPAKVIFSENSAVYKVWKDKYGVWDKMEE